MNRLRLWPFPAALNPASPAELAPQELPVSVMEAPVEGETKSALTVHFSPAPGAPFSSPLRLKLGCKRSNARIHYALGADDVGEDGLIFQPEDEILLTQNTRVAARAFENGECGPLLLGEFEITQPRWQELEPRDQSDAVPHRWSENGRGEGDWKISGASVRGKLHAHRGGWREDSFGLGSARNGELKWQIAALSDGAGSALLSRVGSRIACETAIESLQTSLAALPSFSGDESELEARDFPLLRAALSGAASAALDVIRDEATRRGEAPATLAATLLVLVRRAWNSAQLCAGLQIGDGAIALYGESGLTLLGVADHGEHSSETRFLTTQGIEAEFASRITFSIQNVRAFALLSDGVSDDYFPESQRLGEVFESILPILEASEDGGAALLSWLGYEKRGSSDDRTLVVGWKDSATWGARAEVRNGDFDRDT